MKHRPVDLSSEIKRASLAANLNGFLFPVFEAVSNSLHSIEDRFGKDVATKGLISIVFDRDRKRISVSDNGEGFNKRNLEAFLTPFTGNKFKRNCKGFGRFISFKVYDQVYYAAPTEIKENEYHNLTFKYEPLGDEDNLIKIDDPELIERHSHDRGVTVYFQKPKEEYSHFFDFDSEESKPDYSEESVIAAVLDHFLLEFIKGKIPNRFLCEIGGAHFNLAEYFSGSIKHCDTQNIEIEVDGKQAEFELKFMQITSDKSKKHTLYFYADHRATSDLENISKGLREGAFEDSDGRKYHYLVAASSDYFQASKSRDKIENLTVKVDWNGKSKSIKDILATAAKNRILDLEPQYTTERRSYIRKNVEELITLDPMLRRGLGDQTVEEFVNDRGITETREQLASDLFVVRLRSKFDFRKINSTTPFDELKKVVRKNIPADAKEALAVYVAYRNDVIKVMKEMLERKEGKTSKEDAVHELVYPRFKDSEQIDYSSHNLWLIDDDLAYAQYISSDRTPKGVKREKGLYAHDLLINNQDELLVVEMKRPQKRSFDDSVEPKKLTDHPVQQLKKQVGQIRDYGKVTNSAGREIVIPSDKMVRAYVLIDWNDELETYLKDEDFIITNFGGPMAYKYFDSRNIMIEILAFDRLADRAAKRNEVFVSILNGQSDYTGRQIERLAGE